MIRLILAYLLTIVLIASSQAQCVVIDGNFEDWKNIKTVCADSKNDGNQLDFVEMGVNNDQDFLKIRLKLSKPIVLSENNSIYLEIDADNNESTGYRINGIGAEFGWNFGGRFGYYNKSRNATLLSHKDLGISYLPTFESDEFEIYISRNVRPDGNLNLFTSKNIRILLWEKTLNGDLLPDSGNVYNYRFSDEIQNSYTPISVNPKANEALRCMTWNILLDGLRAAARQESFKRVFQAINPDIITLNECYQTDARYIKDFMDTAMPLENPNGWYVVKRDHSTATCSIFPIVQSWSVMEDHNITANLIAVNNPAFDSILVINAHLTCCEADDQRVLEANAIDEFLSNAFNPNGNIKINPYTPVYISGDFNLVGSYLPIHILTNNSIVNKIGDAKEVLLKMATPLHTDLPLANTWRDQSKTFSPSRLDYFFYTPLSLQPTKAFVLATEEIPVHKLTELKLLMSDTFIASDHLPVVIDFKRIK